MTARTFEHEVEQRVTDAFYTAVGLGVFAFRYSEPYVKRLQAQVEQDLTNCWKRPPR